ncbi:MAG: transcription antitermination factor NusB [Lautropia sp.]
MSPAGGGVAGGGAPGGGASGQRPEARRGGGSRRRRSRELAMQGLYQWLLAGADRGAIQAHLEASPGFERADRPHFEALLHGAIGAAAELDQTLLPFLDRALDQLSPVEHATLMIGSFELLRHREIPYRVVINEAVELAKSYGGTDGYKYVNGVLDRVAAVVRADETGTAAPAEGGPGGWASSS